MRLSQPNPILDPDGLVSKQLSVINDVARVTPDLR